MTSSPRITGSIATSNPGTSSTPGAPGTNLLRNSRRTARALALVLASATAATLASASLGLGPSVAHADPGDTGVAIGSSQLLQSEDLAAIQVKLDTGSITLNRDDPFSSCIGEGSRWTQVLPGSPKPITGTWTNRFHHDQALAESIAQASTPAQAKKYAKTLLAAGVHDCQTKPRKRDFHYGPSDSSSVDTGFATWAVSYRGNDTRPSGGVVVFSKGTNVGFVEVSGTFGPADQTMESVAKEAVNRLV